MRELTDRQRATRFITVEFEYSGADKDDSWVEREIPTHFGAVRDVRVIGVRPKFVETVYEEGRSPSLYAPQETPGYDPFYDIAKAAVDTGFFDGDG